MKSTAWFICIFFWCSVSAQSFTQEDKQSYFRYAEEKYKAGEYRLAIEFCNKILTRELDAETFRLRARAYRAEGDYESALKDYSEAIQRYQIQWGRKDPSLSYDNAMMYICLKRFDRALLELNEARRVFRQNGIDNFLYLEEIGRVNHFMGDQLSAVVNLQEAVKNGSIFGRLDLLTCFLYAGNLFDLKNLSDNMLSDSSSLWMQDSCYVSYIKGLNQIGSGLVSNETIEIINRAFTYYRTTNNSCFQGFYNDLLFARATVYKLLQNDSAAFLDFKQLYGLNNWNRDIKTKLDSLKIKLGYDITPPVVTLRTPLPNLDKMARMAATKRKVSIFGQVSDSAGIRNLVVSATGRTIPVNNVEIDGIFEVKLELNPGINKVIFTATDKNDNTKEETYYIDFSEKLTGIQEELVQDDFIPEIDSSVNYYAVLIAEKDYEDEGFRDLQNPVNDAYEIRDILLRYYLYFKEENIKVLVNATRQAIMDTLIDVYKNMTASDNLLIFYAGHGDVKKINDRIEGGYIIPTDAKKGLKGSYISSEDLQEPVITTQARHVLFVVDACFGGALMRSSLDEAPQSIKNLYNNKSRKILTSGNLEEVPDNGLFIENFKKFLRTPGSKFVRGMDLYNYIVSNNSTPNTPMYERIPSTGDDGSGQFILFKRD